MKPFGTCPANAGRTGAIPNDLIRAKICKVVIYFPSIFFFSSKAVPTFFCKSTVNACHEGGSGPPHPFRLPIRPHGRKAGPAKCASRAAWLTLNWEEVKH